MTGSSNNRRRCWLYRRRCWVYAFTAVVPLYALSCRKSHASSEKTWSLEVKSRGASPRRLLRYQFPKAGWGRYRLQVRVDSDGVQTAGKAVAHIEINARGGIGDRGILEVELTDFQGHGKRQDAVVTSEQKMYWELSTSGRTFRFSAEKLDPALITGLPDMGLLLRRMFPVLPSDPVGGGARWTVLRPFEMEINRESGSGQLQVSERTEYELKELGGSAGRRTARVEARSSADYSGTLRVVARRLVVAGKGQGVVAATLDMASGRLLDAHLEYSDRVVVQGSGNPRKVRTRVTAVLKPRRD